MDNNFLISQSSSLILVIIISLTFAFLGIYHSKKYDGLKNYLIANRNIGLFSLTSSLTASALGAWILFGPASAATWGGLGAIIGYSLGTAFPMFFLIYLGKKIRRMIIKQTEEYKGKWHSLLFPGHSGTWNCSCYWTGIWINSARNDRLLW